jgi:hypothetical protein
MLNRKCFSGFPNCANEKQVIASHWLNRITGAPWAIRLLKTVSTTLREARRTLPEGEIVLWAKVSRQSHRKARGQMGRDTASGSP